MNYFASNHTTYGKLIAHWQEIAGYYRDSNGTVWSYTRQSGFVNCGKIDNETLVKRFRITKFVEVQK